jgi:hypothetical protein
MFDWRNCRFVRLLLVVELLWNNARRVKGCDRTFLRSLPRRDPATIIGGQAESKFLIDRKEDPG